MQRKRWSRWVDSFLGVSLASFVLLAGGASAEEAATTVVDAPDAGKEAAAPAPAAADPPAPEQVPLAAPESPSALIAPPAAVVPDARPSLPAPLPLAVPSLPPLQVHAFASQGFIKSTKNNYLVNSKRGSFEFSEAGINFTQSLGEQLRTGIQLYARRLGKDGNFNAKFDWFYVDYRLADWLGVRVGRTKIPFGLYNETSDIDQARVPVLLPQSVYPTLDRDALLAQTGVELYGYLSLGPVGGLEYRAYGGTIYVSNPSLPPGETLTKLDIPYLVGGRLMWETPVEGLRIGGSFQALRLNVGLNIGGTVTETDLPYRLYLGSAEYVGHDLLVAAEYTRWRGDAEVTTTMAGMASMPPTTYPGDAQRWYAMTSYRVAPWFVPGVYYSSLTADVALPNTRDNYQHDFAATLRFDVTDHWLIKVEGHFIDGVADLSTDLNGVSTLSMLSKDWLLLLVKTTVYF